MLKAQVPMQTFFIPMQEQDLIDRALKVVRANDVSGAFVTLLAFAVTTDYTIIWYDHQEDGYEFDVLSPFQNSTRIWGDGNAANGCSPMEAVCTDATDILMAGETIQIMNNVPVSPRGFSITYDGGDKVYASYPITVTRAGYSERPGSVLGGGVEVYDTEAWGTEYVAPFGIGTRTNNVEMEAFSLTVAFITAKEQTTLFINGDSLRPFFLGPGKSRCFDVIQGMNFTSTSPIQVALVTGDVDSSYEMRWFSLNPVEQWSNDYVTPVGDSQGKTKLILYNNHLTVPVVATLETLTPTKTITSVTVTIPPRGHVLSPIIPFNSGGRISAADGQNFIALSYTDTEAQAGDNSGTGGNMYDWGFPLVQTNKLTPQVVIGLGYGCTGNNCQSETARSPVWVTPTEDAFIFIDYSNSGNITATEKLRVKKFESIRIRSPNNKRDMSGALIFATKWDGNAASIPDPSAMPVDIASAWGQDPSVSTPRQELSLDLGTVTVPFTTVRVSKIADQTSVVPGSNLRYTIRVMNVGQTNVPAGRFKIVDPVLDSSIYVVGSTKYSTNGGVTLFDVPDSQIGTPFPLDNEGLDNLFEMSRRGGTHEVTFLVTVEPTLVNKTNIVNSGWVDEPGRPKQFFSVTTELLFLPSVIISNAVYLGQDDGASCSSRAVEEVGGAFGSDVTYCFTITNSGNTILKIDVINPDIKFVHNRTDVVKPGESFSLSVPRSISTDLINNAIAIGTPLFFDLTPIPYISKVQSTDPSSVLLRNPLPGIKINNTVLIGDNPAIQQSCLFGGVDNVTVVQNAYVTYCLQVINTGKNLYQYINKLRRLMTSER